MRNARILIPTVLFPLIMLALVIVLGLTSPRPVDPVVMSQIACLADSSDQITVVLKPTSEAIPGKVYRIQVRKADVLRASTDVSWTAQEIQTKQGMLFRFPTTAEEFEFYAMDRNQLGYAWKNLSNAFTVAIYSDYSFQTIEYAPGTDSIFNWRLALIALVGLVLLIVYIRIRVSYARDIAREKARRESKEEAEREHREREAKATECPRCHRPYAREEVGSEFLGTELETHIETEHWTEPHYDREHRKIGETERTAHIPVTTSNRIYRVHYRCKYCGHTWDIIS